MKTKETILDILYWNRRGLSQREIARKLGISRQTVKKYLEHPELIGQPSKRKPRVSKLDPYMHYIKQWLEEDCYKATWIYDRLQAMGFDGSYDIVKRRVKRFKEQASHAAYLRFETEAGHQAQVDFGEFKVDNNDGSHSTYYLFAMILGYSRKLYAEFVEHCDLPTFLDCHVRAFMYFGGIPKEILYDRMKNVYIGRVVGKDKFNPTFLSCAIHYGFKPTVAPPYAPWYKGKIERPFSYIREGFWRGYSFCNIYQANRDLHQWLQLKEQRVHGTTHEKVCLRFDRERPYLAPLPSTVFDTSYRIFRKVHKDCMVHYDCNLYMVPHRLINQQVTLRVKGRTLRIFHDATHLVTYTIPSGKGIIKKHPSFVKLLKADHRNNSLKYASPGPKKGRAHRTISPINPHHEIIVVQRPISEYEQYLHL